MADLPTGILNSENSLTIPSREIIVADVVATAKENASASASASAIVAVEDNVEDNAEDNSSCAKKRKFTSVVWNEFKVVTLKDKSQKAECMHCKSHFAYTKGGPTTQYNRYVKTYMRRQIKLSGQQEITIKTFGWKAVSCKMLCSYSKSLSPRWVI